VNTAKTFVISTYCEVNKNRAKLLKMHYDELKNHPEYMTMRQVAAFYGCSLQTVRRYTDLRYITCERKLIDSSLGQKLRVLYNRHEIERFKQDARFAPLMSKGKRGRGTVSRTPTQKGQLCASILRLFREGKTINDVVIETQADPDYVLQVWEQSMLNPQERLQMRELLLQTREMDERLKENERRKFRLQLAEQYAKANSPVCCICGQDMARARMLAEEKRQREQKAQETVLGSQSPLEETQ
jgi:hypothetical protein